MDTVDSRPAERAMTSPVQGVLEHLRRAARRQHDAARSDGELLTCYIARRDEAEGLGDAPWPPHFAKQRGEPRRVAPSKARKET